MSKTASSRIAEEAAVPMRNSSSVAEEAQTIVVDENPVPLRQGAERVEAEEREARLRILTGRRSRWR